MPPDRVERYKVESNERVRPIPHLVEGATKLIAHQIIPVAPLVLEGSGMIEVMMETDRGPLRAGRLMVNFVEPAEGNGAPIEGALLPS
jgi:hypothetical protein